MPDIYITEEVKISNPITRTNIDNGGSDHRPVLAIETVGNQRKKQLELRHILKVLPSRTEIVHRAKDLYEREMPRCIHKTTQAENLSNLKEVSNDFRQTMVQP